MAFVPFTKDDRPTMQAFNEKFEQAIGQALADGVKIEVGSYVGTGTYGVDNKMTLTFGFNPKIVIVSRDYYISDLTVFIQGMTTTSAAKITASGSSVKVAWGENSITFYSTKSSGDQMNLTPSTVQANGTGHYHYIAIG